MLDVTTLSPSADEVNANEDEEAELPPLQDIINYSVYNVTNSVNVWLSSLVFFSLTGTI